MKFSLEDEKGERIEKLRNSESASITGDEIVPDSDLKQYKKNAIQYGKTLTGEYTNADTGRSIMLTASKKNGGIYEILEHDYKDIPHLQSVAAIPQIIEKSIYIDTLPNEDKEKHPNVLSYDYYVCGLKIGDTDYTVKAVVSNMKDGNRYYDHKLTYIEKGKLLDMIKKTPDSSVSISTQTPESDVSGHKDMRLISILQTNSGKNSNEPKFSLAEEAELDEVNERFNQELDDFKEKKHKGLMHLGKPLKILKACGVNAEELTLSPTILHNHLKKHGLDVDDIKGLAKAVQSPILVYRHGKNYPNLVVVTEMDVKGGKLSATLELDGNGNVVEISNIKSIHSKDAVAEMERFFDFSEKELKDALRWVEKEKVSDWLLRLPYEDERTKNNPKLVSVAKVIQEFENPKLSGEKISEEPKFSLADEAERELNRESEESKALFETAKKRFGTTLDIREAGYVLPDGSMLDFSGRHSLDSGMDASYLRGRRSVDHREVANVLNYKEDGNTPSGITTSMSDFIERGAIRIDSNAGTINLFMKPTSKQKGVLRQLVAKNDGYVSVDFGNGNNSEHYVEYEDVRPLRVLSAIDKYYDDGIKPESNIRFSLADDAPFYSNAEKAVEILPPHKGMGKECVEAYEEWKEKNPMFSLEEGKKNTAFNERTSQFSTDSSSSGLVQSAHRSSTDTPRVSFDDAKVRRISQKAKNNIKNFKNGDTEIKKGDISSVINELRKFFSMSYSGNSNYAVYDTPKGRLAFRLATHNAYGGNFKRDNAKQNISVYVALNEYNQPSSDVKFTEYKITPEDYAAHADEFIKSLVDSVDGALKTGDFKQPDYTEKVVDNGQIMFSLDEENVREEKRDREYADAVAAGDMEKMNGDNIVRFSLADEAELDEVNERFNQELDDFKEKKHKGLMHLGKPLKILKACGVNAEELTLSPTVLNRKLKQHDLAADDVKGLAKSIQTPILVYEHGEKNPNLVVVSNLDVQGKKISVALELDDMGNVVELNNISSVHAKEAQKELERLSALKEGYLENHLRWVDKEKVSDWLGIADLIRPIHTNNPKLVSVAKVIQDFENPKLSGEKISVEPKFSFVDEAEFDEVNERFNQELSRFTIENADKIVFDLGSPSDALLAAGVENKPIRLYGSKVAAKIKKHGFSSSELQNLPSAVAQPIAIFDNLGRNGNRSVLTELKTANGNFLVTIDLGKGGDAGFDIVSSVFGKRGSSVVDWINKGLLKYVDKEKALNYLHLSAPIAEASNNTELVSAAKVIREFENPKLSAKNFKATTKFSLADDMESVEPHLFSNFLTKAILLTANSNKDNLQKKAVEDIGTVAPGLADADVPIVFVERHPFVGTGKQAIQKASDWASKNIIGEHTAHQGAAGKFTYIIDEDSIGKFLSSSSTKNSENLGIHLSVLMNLPKVIDNSIDAEVHADYTKKEGKRNSNNDVKSNVLVHRLYGAVAMDGETYRVKTTMYEYDTRTNKPHDYRVTKIELLKSGSSTSDALSNSIKSNGISTISGAKLLNGVEKSYEKGKYLLDESRYLADNGEAAPKFSLADDMESVEPRIFSNILTKAVLLTANSNKDNLQKKADAIKRVVEQLEEKMQKLKEGQKVLPVAAGAVRSAATAQKEYDRGTVNNFVEFAKVVMDAGMMDDVTKGEVKRLLNLAKGVVSKEQIEKSLNAVADLIIDHSLRESKNLLKKQLHLLIIVLS